MNQPDKLQDKENVGQLIRPTQTDRQPGYQYDQTGITAVTPEQLPPSAQLIATAQAGIIAVQDEQHKGLIAPIKLYGQTIGVLGLEAEAEGEGWSTDEVGLLEEVSSQVALAIENARLLEQTQQRTQELSVLFETSRQLSETIDITHIYEIAATQLVNYLNADACTVALLNKSQTQFEEIVIKLKNGHGAGQSSVLPVQLKPKVEAVADCPSLQQMLARPEVIVEQLNLPANDDLTDGTNGGDAPHRRQSGYGKQLQTVATFPLLVRNNLMGVLRVIHLAQPRDYTENELQLARAIISQATVAIENAQLFEQTENALAETQKLYEISRSLVESDSSEEIFEIILGSVNAYHIDQVTIALIEEDQNGYTNKVSIAASWDRDPARSLPGGSEIPAEILSLVQVFAHPPIQPQSYETLSRADGQDKRLDNSFRRFMVEQLGAVTLFSVPLLLGTQYKGVLLISTRGPHAYTSQEARIYQTLADQAVIAIERHRLLEATRRERDRAALLFEFGQQLSQTTTIDEVKLAVLEFTPKIGASYGEMYITDGREFYSMASTIPARQKLSPAAAEELVKVVLAKGTEARALKARKTTIKKIDEEGWTIDAVLESHQIQSLICVPFFSQHSNLYGTLTYFHTDKNAFDPDQVQMFESMAIQTLATLENSWLLLQTATALSDTELLYRATKDFNSCQHVEDLLAILVESFAWPEAQPDQPGGIATNFNHMSIGLITALEEDGAPKTLELVASWNRADANLNRPATVVTSNLKIASDQYPFLRQLSPTKPTSIKPGQAGAELYLAEHLGQARAALSIPLRVGPNWLGVLFVASCADDLALKPNVSNQITTLAGQVAVVIQNLQLVEETQQNLFNSEILSHLSQELLLADTTESIYQLSLDAIAATDPSRGAAIFAYVPTEQGVQFELVAIWDNPKQTWPAILPGARFSADDLGLKPLLKTGQTVASNNVAEDTDFSDTLRQLLYLMQIKSLVAVPIWLNKEVNGFILIGHDTTTAFSADSIWLYENIGRLTSGALENRRLFEEARYRATQLQTAAEVAQAATSHLDLDTLLAQSVDLIRDRFDFYHVSIYLVDDYRKHAVVEASSGEMGQQLLVRKHKVRVGGKNIVGTVTGTGKAQLALDIGLETVQLNNPLLPHTRSEMALPLLARGRVIGALDVHSTRANAFSEADITVLQSMASQLANAIEAARSFQQANQALENMGKLQERYLRKEWGDFLTQQKASLGYRLTEAGFITIDETTLTSNPYQAHLDRAIDTKQPVVLAGPMAVAETEPAASEANRATPAKSSTLVAPLTLHEKVAIGAVDFEALSDEVADEDTLRIVEAITAQAAQAIEAVRLFEQTQAAREEAETLYKVGQALVTAENEQTMFHMVLQNMLSALGLKQGGILFLEQDRKFGRLVALFREGQPVEPNLRIPIAGNPSYQKLISTKQPVAIEDFANDPLVAPVRQINPEHKIASLLLVPIIMNDEVIGALGADAVEQKHHYTEREINLARAIADQLSITLQNRRLLEETRQRAIELQETAERLQEMDKLKTQFLANMSHELRTPLNSIIGFSRVILKGIDGPLTELQKTDLTSIYNSGQHLLGLINNVLDLSKIEAGKMELNFEPVEIGPVIKGVMSTALALVKDKPVELVQELPENLPTVWADATRLRQIILNLVSNACKFTEEGTVTVRATAQKEKMIISVSDTGIGIPPENLEHIFEEFTQVDASTTRKVGGTGLGLPISRHFVEMHQGQIWVDSTLGQGSTFSFAIPLNPTNEIPEPPAEIPSTNGRDGQGKRIVAIDDDPGVINLYKRFLEKRDYTIIGVENSGDVVARVQEQAPAAILLDILMPDKDGWQVLKELKHNPLTRDIPVIICSIISDKNKGFELGVAEYLTKPIVESELVNALKQVDEQQKRQVKVLVIDDHADDILLIRRMLEAHNFQIIEADSGKMGLEFAQTRRPDLVILDLTMPEMDGFAVVDALKKDENTQNLPIIIVSAKEPTPAEHESLTGQVEVLLHKGIFTEHELLEVLNQTLARIKAEPNLW